MTAKEGLKYLKDIFNGTEIEPNEENVQAALTSIEQSLKDRGSKNKEKSEKEFLDNIIEIYSAHKRRYTFTEEYLKELKRIYNK